MKPEILVVDDILLNRRLLSELIKKLGCESKSATNGKEAIDILETKKFDMIFMDIEMPVMNGYEATNYIRENISKDIPIIAITAHFQLEFSDDYEDNVFNGLIRKPFISGKVENLISKHIDKES